MKQAIICYTFLIFQIFSAYSFAELTAGKFTNNPDVDAFIDMMVQKHNFNRKYLKNLFKNTMHSGFTPQLMSKPAESTKTWAEYKKSMVEDIRVNNGVKYFKEHKEELLKAQKAYGVPAYIIVGIIGMETNYGKAPMRFRAMDSISTLAFYYPRRAKYFKSELEALLLFARKTETDPMDIRSSYAGAIGIPQFMPGNVLTYAVSGTGDKHIDIINNHLDAIYSVANFLKKKGWREGEPAAVKVRVKGGGYKKYTAAKPCSAEKTSVGVLKKAGVQFPINVPNDMKAVLYTVDGAKGTEYHAAFNNFCAVFRYNPSIHYVMGVNYLGNTVGAKAGASLYGR